MPREVSRRPGAGAIRNIAYAVERGVRTAYRSMRPSQRLTVAAAPAPAIASTARNIGQYMSRPRMATSASTSTPRYGRSYTGYLSGRKRRLRKRPLNTKAKRKMLKFDKRGIRLNWEEGIAIADVRTVAVGHALPVYKMFKCVMYAIYRSLMVKAGHDFNAWDTTPQTEAPANPGFSITYVSDTQVYYTKTISDIPFGSHDSMAGYITAQIWSQVVDNTVSGWLGLGYRFERCTLKLGWTPTYAIYVDAVEINLNEAAVKFNYTQSMKVQNVTLAADGGLSADQSSDVFNVPLYGRLYEGSGSSLKWKSSRYKAFSTNTPLVTAGDTSAIIRRAAAVEGIPVEPPEAYEFYNCKKFTKIALDPGKIKTSVVTKSFGTTIERFFNVIANVIQHDGASPTGLIGHDTPYGVNRVMYLEKVIGNIGAESQQLQVRVEVDTKLQCYLQFKKNVFAAPIASDNI